MTRHGIIDCVSGNTSGFVNSTNIIQTKEGGAKHFVLQRNQQAALNAGTTKNKGEIQK